MQYTCTVSYLIQNEVSDSEHVFERVSGIHAYMIGLIFL